MEKCPAAFICCAYCSQMRERFALDTLDGHNGVTALVPMKIKKEKHSGQWQTRTKHLLPGYIFIYGDREEDILCASREAQVRLLRYSEGDFVLKDSDDRFARWIWEHNGVVDLSTAARVGEEIRIIDGPLADFKGIVTDIDKRRQLMKVKLEMTEFQVWLSFDWTTA